MRTCPVCGEENVDRARFCFACGAGFEEAAPGGEERKIVSVLFVDLVGFTNRSDRADPEDVRALLRPYHESVKADLERFGGTVEKFIGDAVMAVFGAPVAHEDDAERAVRAGLRILETIDALRDEGLEIAARAAVTTGEAVVALAARPERGEGIVTGDVVNTAARLQSAAPVGSLIVDGTTKRSTEAAIAFEPVESIAAKGKADPIEAWRATATRSRVGQPEAATQTPFVGREHERTVLLETFLRTEREASVQLVTIVGEPGIGKSRLVTELRTALDERPDLVTWRHGRCLPYGEGITFWALGEVVKSEAGILESDDQDVAAGKLSETVAGLVEDESERVWFESRLAPLVGSRGDEAAVSREEAFTAWRRFLEAMAARRPTVLVVEDLHWADAPLLDFLEHLLDWSTTVPLFLLCTARPELFERRTSWGGGKRNATTISLSPLTSDESARLLHVLLDRTLLPAETQATLLERAGGNPLYAEQFVRMLAERGHVEDLAVPETVQALVAARLDTLRPELKSLLHDAAVVGRVFWSGAVAAVSDRERDGVRRDLNELVHREFVRPLRVSSIEDEEEFSFWHALVRDVAYHQIPRSPRSAKHVAAARWVEDTAAERVADHAEILVHHYGQAVELARAAGDSRPETERELVRYLLLAGERASHLDTEAAETYLRRAVGLSEHDELARARALAQLAPVLSQRGEVHESIEAAESAIPVLRAQDPTAAAQLLNSLATGAWSLGEMERARDFGLDAIGLLEDDPGPALVSAYGSFAMREALAARFDEAEPLIAKGLALAEELGVEDTTSLLQAQASVAGYQGDPSALEHMREAIDVGLRLGLGRAAAVAMNNLADGLAYFVGVREALAQLDAAIEFSRSRGLTYAGMWQRGERLRALYHLGEWDELRREADEVVPWVGAHGGGQLEVIARIYLTDLLVHRGELDEAATNVAQLLPGARASGDPQVLVPGLVAATLVAGAQGDSRRALEILEELQASTRKSPVFRDHCLVWPSRVAVSVGRADFVEAFLDDEEYDAAWNRCARSTARALLAEHRGERLEASALYREAADRWEAYGSVVEQAYALLGLGRCGDGKALRDGQGIFDRLGARPVATARAA